MGGFRYEGLGGSACPSEGKGRAFEGAIGAEINYGAAPNVQITVGLPAAFVHDENGTGWGAGDVALSLKYRFYHNDAQGVSIAVFPGLTLPTAAKGFGAEEVTGLLPVWAQKTVGPWTVFGAAGYAFNPGACKRDYVTGGIAFSRQVTPNLLLGVEADRQSADAVDAKATTSLGLGAIYHLPGPYRLLASAGPTFEDGTKTAGFHAFLALGLDF